MEQKKVIEKNSERDAGKKPKEYFINLDAKLAIDKSVAGITKVLKNELGVKTISRYLVERYLKSSDAFSKYAIVSKNNETTIPREVEPLIAAFLYACHSSNNKTKSKALEFRKSYLEKLEEAQGDYFRCKRNNNTTYQIATADNLCLDPLINRIATVLMLSQIARPQVRLELMGRILGELEALISETICGTKRYVVNDGKFVKKHTIYIEKDCENYIITPQETEGEDQRLSFSTLAQSLSIRQYGKTKVTEEQNIKFNELNNRSGGKRTEENIVAAEEEYEIILKQYLSKEEKTASDKFEKAKQKLDDYLNPKVEQSLESIKVQVRKELTRYAKDLSASYNLQAPSVSAENIPASDLLIERSIEKKKQELLNTFFYDIRLITIGYTQYYAIETRPKKERYGHYFENMKNILNRSRILCTALGIELHALKDKSGGCLHELAVDVSTFRKDIYPHRLQDHEILPAQLESALLRVGKYTKYIFRNSGTASEKARVQWTKKMSAAGTEIECAKSTYALYHSLVEAAMTRFVDTFVAEIADEVKERRQFNLWIKTQKRFAPLCQAILEQVENQACT